MFVCDTDAASKKTIYTYVTVPRDTQTAELRIYDEIPQSKVRWCYSWVSTTGSQDRESWAAGTAKSLTGSNQEIPGQGNDAMSLFMRTRMWSSVTP